MAVAQCLKKAFKKKPFHPPHKNMENKPLPKREQSPYRQALALPPVPAKSQIVSL